MLYCSQNCQLKGNTWNTAARAGADPHTPPTPTPPPPYAPAPLARDRTKKPSAPPHHRGPWRMFFFPSPPFSFLFFFHPPPSPALFMKSCRQRTFTLAHAAHNSPGVAAAALPLLNRINKGGRFLGGAYGPGHSVNLLRATLLKTKTAVILSSARR